MSEALRLRISPLTLRATVWKCWDANTAVLSGDTMLLRAFRKLSQCRCERWNELYQLYTDTFIEVCEGQQFDMNFENRRADDVQTSEYLEMIRLKTSVLIACAAKAGGIIAGAGEADCILLYAFAEKVGLAFQLQDDVLDVWGDPATFGDFMYKRCKKVCRWIPAKLGNKIKKYQSQRAIARDQMNK